MSRRLALTLLVSVVAAIAHAGPGEQAAAQDVVACPDVPGYELSPYASGEVIDVGGPTGTRAASCRYLSGDADLVVSVRWDTALPPEGEPQQSACGIESIHDPAAGYGYVYSQEKAAHVAYQLLDAVYDLDDLRDRAATLLPAAEAAAVACLAVDDGGASAPVDEGGIGQEGAAGAEDGPTAPQESSGAAAADADKGKTDPLVAVGLFTALALAIVLGIVGVTLRLRP